MPKLNLDKMRHQRRRSRATPSWHTRIVQWERSWAQAMRLAQATATADGASPTFVLDEYAPVDWGHPHPRSMAESLHRAERERRTAYEGYAIPRRFIAGVHFGPDSTEGIQPYIDVIDQATQEMARRYREQALERVVSGLRQDGIRDWLNVDEVVKEMRLPPALPDVAAVRFHTKVDEHGQVTIVDPVEHKP